MIKFVVLAIFLVVAFLSLRSMEPRTLYYPDRTLVANPGVYRLVFEDLHLVAMDGTKIHGWYVPASAKAATDNPVVPTILFSHGNAGNISHRLDKLEIYHKLGVNVLMFDYRGYGLSEGTPTEDGTYEDAEAAYQWLRKRGVFNVVFQGESLGCAVAMEMAVRHPEGRGLILESPFTSTIAMAKLIFPWLPVKWIVRYHYDNVAKIPGIRMPLLILHSPQDDIVPFAMGRALYSAAHEPKKFVELVGGHNEGYAESGRIYPEAVAKFIQSIKRPVSGGLR